MQLVMQVFTFGVYCFQRDIMKMNIKQNGDAWAQKYRSIVVNSF